MSKTGRINYRRGARGSRKAERYITVRGERRDPPDLHKLSRAVIARALRDAEAKAEVHEAIYGRPVTNGDQPTTPAHTADRKDVDG